MSGPVVLSLEDSLHLLIGEPSQREARCLNNACHIFNARDCGDTVDVLTCSRFDTNCAVANNLRLPAERVIYSRDATPEEMLAYSEFLKKNGAV